MMTNIKLKICWWNTGLAPPVGESNDARHLEMVRQRVKLLFEKEVDLLCLGEVNAETVEWLKGHFNGEGLSFISRAKGEDGTRFNMGFVFKTDRVLLGPCAFHVTVVEGASKKMAQSTTINLRDGPPILLFVVHWPSRLYVPPESHLRAVIGQSLRDQINLSRMLHKNENVIVLGDFNDEPYNDSIARYLYSTRDIEMVKKYPNLLYNPFWRLLPSRGQYFKGSTPPLMEGSYYYASDKAQRWRVFDQILLSRPFIDGGPWHLNEQEAIIWDMPQIFDVGPSMSKMIDHLPVFTVLEKEV